MDPGELGAFLRTRRERTLPRDVGLLGGPRRRVPGLRHAEVAQMAGTSPQYYRRLEQAAGARPSEVVLANLARALRLDADERDHVFDLAGRPPPVQGGAASHVPPGLLHLIDDLRTTPAQVLTDLQVVLTQNRLATLLFGADVRDDVQVGLTQRWFTDAATRSAVPESEHHEHGRALVAELRAAVSRREVDGHEDAHRLVTALLATSPDFAALWQAPTGPAPQPQRWTVLHRSVGAVLLERRVLCSADDRQRLVWFTPAPGSDAARKLELLAVVGLHEFERRDDP